MPNKSLPWFRMYTDFLDDPKMISIAFEDQRHFIGILALKSAGVLDQGGNTVLIDRIVAQKLWIDYSIIGDVKKRLMDAGLIHEDWQPVAWSKRQRRSDHDSTGAERQKRYRENKRNASRNATVTPPEEIRGEDNREDTPQTPQGATEKTGKSEYTKEFERAWDQYPKRDGGNPKKAAYKAWLARLKQGWTPDELAAGVVRYARHLEARGKVGTPFVMQASRFFGPDEPFTETYNTPQATTPSDFIMTEFD